MELVNITNRDKIVQIIAKKVYTNNGGIKLILCKPYVWKENRASIQPGWWIMEYYTGLMITWGDTINETIAYVDKFLSERNVLTVADMNKLLDGQKRINL